MKSTGQRMGDIADVINLTHMSHRISHPLGLGWQCIARPGSFPWCFIFYLVLPRIKPSKPPHTASPLGSWWTPASSATRRSTAPPCTQRALAAHHNTLVCVASGDQKYSSIYTFLNNGATWGWFFGARRINIHGVGCFFGAEQAWPVNH